eukprot:TRINITY_DN75584_c0_g1_i1.p1 TRINITY_DN75584_c0_g1~~TRINITY_DN75584_c0_g1_i1.p1  ORF type:complete len:578 (+),score=127.77 TRINITY_DN75584_c0_g1_i1:35-1768(+)
MPSSAPPGHGSARSHGRASRNMREALPGQRDKPPQLPKLQPNVNRRATKIIAAHLQSVQENATPTSSCATIPVLTKLESTASRQARTHDISHRCDQPKFLATKVPPSLIQAEDHIYETSFMAKDATSTYNESDGLWHTKVFPSEMPSSRTDAVMLDAWITRALDRYQREVLENATGKEDFAETVQDLVPILSVALHELVRQVMHHCAERGVALERIWRTYVELFQRVLHQMQESLSIQKKKTTEVNSQLLDANQEFKALKKAHPEQMHRIISDLEVRFTQRQKGFEEELREAEVDNESLKQSLRSQHKEMELWYPNFTQYRDSYIRTLIPQHIHFGGANKFSGAGRHEAAGSEMAPEVAIAEDFKRLLTVLAPEKRKLIGQELRAMIETTTDAQATGNSGKQRKAEAAKAADDATSMMERQKELDNLEKLQAEVQEQEDHIKRLKAEIAKLEAKKDFPDDEDSDLDEGSSVSSDENLSKGGLDENDDGLSEEHFHQPVSDNEGEGEGTGSGLAQASSVLLAMKEEGSLILDTKKSRKSLTDRAADFEPLESAVAERLQGHPAEYAGEQSDGKVSEAG